MSMDTERFTLTEDHLKLLRRANVTTNYGETESPGLCTKRPYGNGDVVEDVAEIIGIESFRLDEDDSQYDEALYDKLWKLHKEVETALQIILTTQSFVPGDYECEFLEKWKLV